ncbi:MAG: VWA domain-containing protein [Gammaproteobacteria bacterium]|nr:VWA domain-containing protein [Gammaproteobacteria bacterium]
MKLPPLPGLLWIILLWALFYGAQTSFAEEKTAAPPDLRVLIDVSGSMKKTDPNNLRVPAVKLLLNLAQDGSQLGIWMFDQGVKSLVPHGKVSADWKKSAAGKVDAIHSRGLFTGIGAALEAAARSQNKPDPAWDRTIILLSDGMVDIAKNPAVNERERKRILDEIVPKLKAGGFRIRTVALSDQADQSFLRSLALNTGGSFVIARNADELLKAFVTTADKVNLPEQVPIEGDTFSIDESVKEFTALIFRKAGGKPTELVAPDGLRFSLSKGSRNVSWFADQRYDLITVYNPQPGKWKVAGDLDPSNRVTVVSDLQLEVEGLPDSVLEGEKITMRMHLAEHGRAIANPNFLELMEITFSQQTASGETFEGKLSRNADGTSNVPADGVYSAKLGRTLLAGDHTFTLLVDGKTFKRKKQYNMTVYRDVLDVKTEYRDENGQVVQLLVAEPRVGMVNAESLQLAAKITDPNGRETLQPVKQRDDGRWQVDVLPFGAQGVYQVALTVKGTSLSGRQFEMLQGPYPVDYTPLTQSMADAPATVKSDQAPVTFDASALDIPSLDVEELPPDDMPLPEDELAATETAESVPGPEADMPADEPAPVQPVAESDAEEPAPAEPADESTPWVLLISLFILGNVAIAGVGLFFYLKFLRKTDVKQKQVVEDIQRLKQRQLEENARRAEAGAEPAPVVAAAVPAAMVDELPGIPEEATVMRVTEPAAAPVPPPAPPVVAKETNYVMQAAPLELDDDEMIEIDDDFDDVIEEEDVPNLDDLDMMLNEQEEGASDTSINRTIDEMLEEVTGKKPGPGKKPGFAEDEFKLDNPATKK